MRGEHLLDLGGQRRRVHRFGEDAQPAALARRLGRQRAADRGDEAAPRPDAAQLGDRVRPVGVVEGEDRGLREDVGAAAGRRMIGVALDLGGPTLVALDQQPGGDAAERHRGGEEQRLAGHDVLGHAARRARSARRAGAVQPVTPASASDAPISFRKPRRPTGSFHSEALAGNSRWRNSWNSGVSATASRLRQYCGPLAASSRARMAFEIRGSALIVLVPSAFAASPSSAVRRAAATTSSARMVWCRPSALSGGTPSSWSGSGSCIRRPAAARAPPAPPRGRSPS